MNAMDVAADAAGVLGPKPSHRVVPEEGYARFEEYVRLRVAAGCGPLLTVMPDDDDAVRVTNEFTLWQRCFLDRLPADRRQHYTCTCCERFVRRYGGLVVVHDDGTTGSVLWSPYADEAAMVPAFFRPAVRALAEFVEAQPVRGVFLDAAITWGTPATGPWTHLSGVPRPSLVHAVKPTESLAQAVAARREGFHMVKRALAGYPESVARTALEVLRLEAVPNGEKALGVAEWFHRLHLAVAGAHGPLRDNLIWRAVATSPDAFWHVNNTMISTLLDDLAAGKPMAEVKRAWVAKMDPGRYRRAQVAPTAGQVAAANRTAEQLGVTPQTLARRFARLAEIPAQARLWAPPDATPPSLKAGGTFSGVSTRPARHEPPATLVGLEPTTMTWEKFARTVLDSALEVKFRTPAHRASFYGLLTAADPAGPPLFQWDGLEGQARNPVNWYVEREGSLPARWNLPANAWVGVRAVLSPPYRWNDRPHLFAHHMDRAFLVLDGARETFNPSLCLFMEVMRADFNPIRAVVEQYSREGLAAGKEEGDANGYVLTKQDARATLWVRTAHTAGVYRIDRWD